MAGSPILTSCLYLYLMASPSCDTGIYLIHSSIIFYETCVTYTTTVFCGLFSRLCLVCISLPSLACRALLPVPPAACSFQASNNMRGMASTPHAYRCLSLPTMPAGRWFCFQQHFT